MTCRSIDFNRSITTKPPKTATSVGPVNSHEEKATDPIKKTSYIAKRERKLVLRALMYKINRKIKEAEDVPVGKKTYTDSERLPPRLE